MKIHLYKPRFLHAKHLSIDDDIAIVGSTNMDIRSFALNAEINILVYDPKVVAELRLIQEKYFANSDMLTCSGMGAPPPPAQGRPKHRPPRRLALVRNAGAAGPPCLRV